MPQTPLIKIWIYAHAPGEFTSLFPDAGSHAWIAHVPLCLADTAVANTISQRAARAVAKDGSVLYLGHVYPYVQPWKT